MKRMLKIPCTCGRQMIIDLRIAFVDTDKGGYAARECWRCKRMFVPRRHDQHFCDRKCSAAYHSKRRRDKAKAEAIIDHPGTPRGQTPPEPSGEGIIDISDA